VSSGFVASCNNFVKINPELLKNKPWATYQSRFIETFVAGVEHEILRVHQNWRVGHVIFAQELIRQYFKGR